MLDLTEYTADGDTPEVRELKATVREVAKKYTAKYSWCNEVNSALKEMGIEAVKTVKVDVTTSHPFSFTVKVDPYRLVGLTEDAQKKVLADIIGDVKIGASSSVVGAASLKITPASIVTMTLKPSLRRDATETREGHWMYVSSEGRVRHLMRQGYRREVTTCGADAWYPTETSARGKGDYCKKCVKAQDES